MNRLVSDLEMNLGTNLRALRKAHKLTQDAVVARMGIKGVDISRSKYSRYETGELNVPVCVLVVLEEIYGCGFDAFFVGFSLKKDKQHVNK